MKSDFFFSRNHNERNKRKNERTNYQQTRPIVIHPGGGTNGKVSEMQTRCNQHDSTASCVGNDCSSLFDNSSMQTAVTKPTDRQSSQELASDASNFSHASNPEIIIQPAVITDADDRRRKMEEDGTKDIYHASRRRIGVKERSQVK